MEIIIILAFFVCIIAIVVKLQKRVVASDDARLDRAWRIVLADPGYNERRPLEERKYAAQDKARALGEAARQTSRS